MVIINEKEEKEKAKEEAEEEVEKQEKKDCNHEIKPRGYECFLFAPNFHRTFLKKKSLFVSSF